MQINIIAIGTKMPSWVTSGYDEYVKRLSKYSKINLIELPLASIRKNNNNNTNSSTAKKLESNQIISQIRTKLSKQDYIQDHIIALDLNGAEYSTERFSEYLNNLLLKTHAITFLIGGPDGFSDECLALAKDKISLSQFTLPHPLVRVVLVEQLYRAFSLLNNHPYHK